jgi:integrase
MSKLFKSFQLGFSKLYQVMRVGELLALEWDDVDFENKNIRVSKSYSRRMKETKCTKAGYWRNVPMSSELNELFVSLKANAVDSKVLPNVDGWGTGGQSKFLRRFLVDIGVTSVKFHALRACFATQLLSKGTPSAVVMKICGWRDLKTMDIYIRVAGVDERGATDCLKILPNEVEAMENVVSLFKD